MHPNIFLGHKAWNGLGENYIVFILVLLRRIKMITVLNKDADQCAP